MSYAAEQQAIMGRINTQWVSGGTARTPIAWPNAHFEPTGVAYIEPFTNPQEAFNAAFTATDKLVRHPGMLTINVRVPINTGDGTARELADLAAAMFRNITFSSITFRAPRILDIGPEDPWYRVQVDCPYQRDTILSHA